MKITAWIATASILILTACSSSPSAEQPAKPESQPPNWTGSMRDLKKSLTVLEPFLFEEKKFESQDNQKTIQTEIHNLATTSKTVRHDPTIISRDPTVRFVAAHFAEDLQRADTSFSEGKKNYARYELMKVVGYCVECHTRTSQGPDFKFSAIEPFYKQMSSVNQVEFLIATRRFDQAFEAVKAALKNADKKSPGLEMDKLARMGLQVSIQYQERPQDALLIAKTILDNPALPPYLKQRAASWQVSLAGLKGDNFTVKDLAVARKLVRESKSDVDSMRAVAGLLKMLSVEQSQNQLGEALLLTGEGYELLNEISPLDLHENYYESCVRRVPHTTWSKQCFKKLEASVTLGYSGSAGVDIPVEIQIYLQNLKKDAE